MPPALLDLAIDAGATVRLTSLVVDDKITQPIRDRIAERWPRSFLDQLVTCPYCASVWVAAGVQVARAVAPRPWSHVARGLALAAIAGPVAARL